MYLTIARWPIELDLQGVDMTSRLGVRYGPFLSPGPPPDPATPFTFEIRIEGGARPPGVHPVFVDNPALRAEGTRDRARVVGDGFSAEFDWERGRGHGSVPDSLAHVDLLVRIALGVGLLRERGILLHASGVLRDRFGVVFSGPSGAGKSTIARLCREEGLEVLADEMLAFRVEGLGARFHGSPFWNGAPLSGPAGAVLFLEKSLRPNVEPLPPARALPRLLAAGGAPVDLADVQHAFFDACAAMLRRVPAYRLEFAPDPGFWQVLDRLPEFAYFRPHAAVPAVPPGPAPVPLAGLAPGARRAPR